MNVARLYRCRNLTTASTDQPTAFLSCSSAAIILNAIRGRWLNSIRYLLGKFVALQQKGELVMKRALQAASLLALLVFISTLASSQTNRRRANQKPVDALSDEQTTAELKQLRRMSAGNKAKVRRALKLLQESLSKASVSTDLEEIAEAGSSADEAVDAAEAVMPNGALKGTMISCKKALGHSYFLRFVRAGGLSPEEPDVAKLLEEIMIRYQLARIPSYERPAKVLDFAEFHITVAKKIAFVAGIVSK